MKIVDIYLDDLDKKEYLSLIIALTQYYYVMFDECIELNIGENNAR